MQQVLTEMCGEADRAAELGLAEPVVTDVCLIDTTCLEANIHFPVDWVLLRDVATTLLKARSGDHPSAAGRLPSWRHLQCEPHQINFFIRSQTGSGMLKRSDDIIEHLVAYQPLMRPVKFENTP